MGEKALKDLQQKEQEDLDITVQELDDKLQMMKESMEVNINLIQKSSEEDNERKLADIDDKIQSIVTKGAENIQGLLTLRQEIEVKLNENSTDIKNDVEPKILELKGL